MKRVLVFGTFDGLHPGHISFLTQAKTLGDTLSVCVARDATVTELKRKTAKHSQAERIKLLRASGLADKVLLGDALLGSYECVKEVDPSVIAIGYDQHALYADVLKWIQDNELNIDVHLLNPFKPEQYKTSLLDV